MDFVARVLLSYLLGSIVGSLAIGRLRGIDIRKLGSGNAGGTNAWRTQGALFALGVMVIDVAKGWLATRLVPFLPLPWPVSSAGAAVTAAAWLPAACGLAAILGHVFPLWHGFRGGKGAATLVGAVAGLAPVLLLPALGTWLVAVMAFGYVGLASMLAAASLPVAVILLRTPPILPLLAFAGIVALFVAYTHRANVARMRAGTEPRAVPLWLFRPRSRPG